MTIILTIYVISAVITFSHFIWDHWDDDYMYLGDVMWIIFCSLTPILNTIRTCVIIVTIGGILLMGVNMNKVVWRRKK